MSENNGEPPVNNVVDFAARRKQVEAPSLSREVAIVAGADGLLEAFGAYIERGMVMVTLDATLVGVAIPTSLRGNPQLNLNFSHRFFIDDFVYDERGVRASLSFSGQPFTCDIPWSAIWMLRCHADDQITLAPSHVPEALRSTLLVTEPTPGDDVDVDASSDAGDSAPRTFQLATPPVAEPVPLPLPSTEPTLAAADAGEPEGGDVPSDASEDEPDDEPPTSGPPVLKLIKS